MPEISIGSVILVIALFVGLLVLATYGRRRGYLKSSASKVALIIVVGVLAALVMFGPSVLMLAE